jgi:hypothetical protein
MVLNNVDNIMLGSNEVDKIYCGSNVIWERESSILPAGYTQKEYLQTSGEQVIDTGYILQSSIFKVETQIEPTAVSIRDIALISNNTFGIDVYYNQLYFWTNSNSHALYSGELLSVDTVFNVIIENTDSNKFMNTNGNVTAYNSPGQLAQNERNLTIFKSLTWGDGFQGKMYYCKIYDNDILVRDFIPAVRDSDGKAGFYDLVTNQFFTNAGTGADFTTN